MAQQDGPSFNARVVDRVVGESQDIQDQARSKAWTNELLLEPWSVYEVLSIKATYHDLWSKRRPNKTTRGLIDGLSVWRLGWRLLFLGIFGSFPNYFILILCRCTVRQNPYINVLPPKISSIEIVHSKFTKEDLLNTSLSLEVEEEEGINLGF